MAQKTPESRVNIVANIFLVIAILWSISFIFNVLSLPAQSKAASFDALFTGFSMVLSLLFIFGFYFTWISLKKRQPWSRRLALWISVPLCLSILGIIVTWYIWKQLGYVEVKALFEGAATQNTQPTQLS